MAIRLIILVLLNFWTAAFLNQSLGQSTKVKQILWAADWSPNGKYIAIGGNVDTLTIYNSEDLSIHKSVPVKNTITRMQWHPTKKMLAVATQNSADKPFILNEENNEKIELTGISAEGSRGLDWNNTGEYLAIADNDGFILIYDVKGNLIKKFNNENTKSITAIEWHPQKNILTTLSDKIRFFDIDGKLLKSIKHRTEDVLLLSLAWHSSGDFFVIGDYGDADVKSWLQFWSEQGELMRTIDISKGEYRNIAWNPAGDRLATASDALRIWDKNGNLISEGLSPDYLWGLAWNESGTRIVTSSMEQRIILWNRKAKKMKSLD